MKAEEGLLYIQSANHAFFKNLPEELTSPEKETRITAVEAMRMDDKVYKPLQGPIFIPFAEHEENTIMALAQTVNDCQTMYSIERGGSVTGEKINAARRFPIEHHKITKHAHGTSQQSKIPEELITSIKTQYTNHCATNTNVLKIALAETCIGGGSVNALITMLSETFPTNTYPKLQVKLVILAQTIQNDIFDPSDILQRDIELIHNVDEVSHVKINDLPNNVELNMGLTPYITAEDVDYQANHQSRDSDKGIYFLGTNGDIVHTQPHPTKTTRETLVSIISGGHLQTIKNTLSEARMSSSSSR